MELTWLPQRESWSEELRALPSVPADEVAGAARQAATSRMDFAQAIKLDRVVTRLLATHRGGLPGLERVRVALLGSSTTAHLRVGLRLAGLRRGLQLEIYEAPFGMYRQELFDPKSPIVEFAPQVVLFALDARHIAGLAAQGGAAAALEQMQACWRQARERFGCQVLQQTVLPVFPALLGNNEYRLPCSPATLVSKVNQSLRALNVSVTDDGVALAPPDLLAVDTLAAQFGLPAIYEASLWHHAKQEVHPRAAALWGEHAARLIAAARGRSAKCLVLDLDNTLWGGVVGDDGLEGIVLGQGSARGEAFTEFQRYCHDLASRGVVLAVCSKNDPANAREPFERHPEMVLRSADIACFVANWTDKATNLREIAGRLHLGLDALVFVDDNPVERALIRRELPEVYVPELPEDPAEFAATIAAAGYFEALGTTAEDHARGAQYRANLEREELRSSATDMNGYLRSLNMVLTVAPVSAMNLTRVTQLLNKTNQFNLLTRRRSEGEVAALARNPHAIALQARLTDRFGDNGIIAVVTACLKGDEACIEDWLMSCRVLGRRVEEACLQVLASSCAERGARRLLGEFRPTAKNGLVRDMFASLGFAPLDETSSGVTRWVLDLNTFTARELPIVLHAASGATAQAAEASTHQAEALAAVSA